jgi:hypothetical protein
MEVLHRSQTGGNHKTDVLGTLTPQTGRFTWTPRPSARSGGPAPDPHLRRPARLCAELSSRRTRSRCHGTDSGKSVRRDARGKRSEAGDPEPRRAAASHHRADRHPHHVRPTPRRQ